MKKLIPSLLIALLFCSFARSQDDPKEILRLHQPGFGNYTTLFTVIDSAGTDTTSLFSLFEYNSLQIHVADSSGDSVHVQIDFLTSYQSWNDSSFTKAQTICTISDTGWVAIKPIFAPWASWGKIVMRGLADNDTTYIDDIRRGGSNHQSNIK